MWSSMVCMYVCLWFGGLLLNEWMALNGVEIWGKIQDWLVGVLLFRYPKSKVKQSGCLSLFFLFGVYKLE